MGRPPSEDRCVKGFGFGKVKHRHRDLPPGPCELCGVGPLHGAAEGGFSSHGCSFNRAGVRVCRTCAWYVDHLETGTSRVRVKDVTMLDYDQIGKRYRRFLQMKETTRCDETQSVKSS